MAPRARPVGRGAGRVGWDTLALLVALNGGGCTVAGWPVIRALYEPAALPSNQVSRDLVYATRLEGPLRLDLFRPRGTNWPSMVFAYGGGWREGHKDAVYGGADVYANIGRVFANRGIGVAVIEYRAQPDVTWRGQVDDVAAAVVWMRDHVESYGGDPSQLFVAGHSAGAQLTTYVAVSGEVLGAHGLARGDIAGVIAVGVAGVDLTDPRQFDLGVSERYYESRFAPGGGDWRRDGSAVLHVTSQAPPFLIAYAGEDPPWLERQSELLWRALRRHGVPTELRRRAAENHYSLVLALSREGELVDGIVSFIATRRELARLERWGPLLGAGATPPPDGG